jgi:CelD/BcsL family acetyltransferase involved in cellulose biosynthesis
MPVVNTSPISERIAEWALETACATAAAWERAGHSLRIGVNLSPSQFKSGDLAASVAQALAKTGLSPTSLEFTEDILLDDDEGALNTFLKIQALGVRIVFDDFGTGFASLSYLEKFPLDGLKIDRSFVFGLLGNPDDAAIVSSTIGLRRLFGLSVIAEGIEPGHGRFPRRHGLRGRSGLFVRTADAGKRFRSPIPRRTGLPPSWPDGRILKDALTRPLKSEPGPNGIFHFLRLVFEGTRCRQAALRYRLHHREPGFGEVAEIAESAGVRRASIGDGGRACAPAATAAGALTPLAEISVSAWRALCERAIEPNGYYLPEWELAVNTSARDRAGAAALCAWGDTSRLIGLMPVVSLWRACKVPLPALVSADPYGTLSTPPLDRDLVSEAAAGLLQQARRSGTHALILRDMSLDGAAMKSFADALRRDGMQPIVLQSHVRACLDASRDADELLREALGPKKLKELRRQRNRLAEHGAISFDVASEPGTVAVALETLLKLEASGWKGERGTALGQHAGDAAFIRRATEALAETGQCEIMTLRAGDTPVASAIVLRHQDRAFYFKLGVDERFSKFSPGVQLTLDLTRHLCADPSVRLVDSTADADHPMINPIWRGRLAIGDVLIPLRQRDPIVALIHAALGLRKALRAATRHLVRLIRKHREKSSSTSRHPSRP